MKAPTRYERGKELLRTLYGSVVDCGKDDAGQRLLQPYGPDGEPVGIPRAVRKDKEVRAAQKELGPQVGIPLFTHPFFHDARYG